MLSGHSFSHVHSECLRALLEHWLAIRGDRLMPARRDLDPVRIVKTLPRIWICDYEPEGDRFVFRLAGEEIRAVYPTDLRGKCITELFAANERPGILARLHAVIEEPCIAHSIGAIYSMIGRAGSGERLMLPLSKDGRVGHGVVGATMYDWGVNQMGRTLRMEDIAITYTPLTGEPQRTELAVSLQWPEERGIAQVGGSL